MEFPGTTLLIRVPDIYIKACLLPRNNKRITTRRLMTNYRI